MAGGVAGPLPAVSRVRTPIPLYKLILITLPWFGVQFAWSAEFATNVSYMGSLGLSRTAAGLTWSAGPVTGLLVQPIVGAFSDRCRSKLGRRRPFLIGGAILTVLMQFAYAWALELGTSLGDTGCHRHAAIAVAVTAFWGMDATINVIQTPLRAIVADVAHVEQQELGQSLASLWNALGAVAGFLASAWIDPVVNIRLFLGIASTLVAATTAIACVSVKERALGEAEEEAQPALVAAPGPEASKAVSTYEAAAEAFRNMGRGVCAMPKGMRRLCLLQFLTWGAWFTYNPYWASWAGSYLYSGTAPGVPTCAANGTLIHPSSASTHAEHLYRDGTSLAGFAQASAAGLQLLFSFAAPTLSRVVGLRVTYAASFVVLVAALGGLGALPPVHRLSASKPLAFALMAATGIPLAATNIFPFSIIGRIYPSDPNLALYMGAMNVFIALPQLLDTTYTGELATATSYRWVLATGAVWAVLALAAIFGIPTEQESEDGDELRAKRRPSSLEEGGGEGDRGDSTPRGEYKSL